MKKSRVLFISIIILSILHRFYFQFLAPVFNIDEISLGNNIKHLSYLELLYPLNNYQSAPPLYLLLQKAIISIAPFQFWINIKLLSFLVSISTIILFYRLLSKKTFWISLLLLLIFCFNPYLVYNSLTLKQYGIDLLGVLILLVYFKKEGFNKWGWLFFMIWCLLSNVGLFACAGYLIFCYFGKYRGISFNQLLPFLKTKLLVFMAPVPYILYFIWYIQQEGAAELKRFMVVYWKNSFIPLNESIITYIPQRLHELWICFFSAYEVWGILIMLISLSVFYGIVRRKKVNYRDEILLMLSIIAVHLILNLLQMYPLSDRLFLYMAPLFLLMLGSSLYQILNKKLYKFKNLMIIPIICITVGLYYTYSDYKNNDLLAVYDYFEEIKKSDRILVTARANEYINKANDFTDGEFKKDINFIEGDVNDLESYDFLISKIHTKLKPGITSSENVTVEKLLQQIKIKLIKSVAGYKIYEVVKT